MFFLRDGVNDPLYLKDTFGNFARFITWLLYRLHETVNKNLNSCKATTWFQKKKKMFATLSILDSAWI